jgi:hypothetical protein
MTSKLVAGILATYRVSARREVKTMRKLIMPEQSWKVEDAKNEETETPSTSNPVDPAKLSFSYARI